MKLSESLKTCEEDSLGGTFGKRRRDSIGSPSAILICDEEFDAYADLRSSSEEKTVNEGFGQLNEGFVRGIVTADPVYHPSYSMVRCPRSQVRPRMRAILVDNVRKVCAEVGRSRECCYVAINIIDRLIVLDTQISIDNFQLYGIVAMYLASQMIVYFK
jgi:hypothetical protein